MHDVSVKLLSCRMLLFIFAFIVRVRRFLFAHRREAAQGRCCNGLRGHFWWSGILQTATLGSTKPRLGEAGASQKLTVSRSSMVLPPCMRSDNNIT